jgi:hypothetical protein
MTKKKPATNFFSQSVLRPPGGAREAPAFERQVDQPRQIDSHTTDAEIQISVRVTFPSKMEKS